jgi:opacity protein-like surface antigen
MKKLLLSTLAGALLIPSAALAQFNPIVSPLGDQTGYSNRGQCQSALMQLRNEARNNDATDQGYTPSQFNYYTGLNFECRQMNGRYFIYQIDAQGGTGR